MDDAKKIITLVSKKLRSPSIDITAISATANDIIDAAAKEIGERIGQQVESSCSILSETDPDKPLDVEMLKKYFK